MDGIIKYALLCDDTPTKLSKKVNGTLEKGYSIQGNHTVTSVNPETMIMEYCVSVAK